MPDHQVRLEDDTPVPANVTATVVLPGDGDITESGADAAMAPGVDRVWLHNGAWIAEVGSGTYEFTVA